MKWGRDIVFLFKKLIIGYRQYFHNGYVNSDGRRLLEEILRMMMYEHPEFKRRIYKVRRCPSIENILKLGELVAGPVVYEWLNEVLNEPYYYRC
ncbi:MAG: hypothetical protein J7J82_04175 [Staphylothermus sp.]|nr:hypothetical protein [Staphylothermus sp.]